MKRKIIAILAIVGFIIVLGTAGASDYWGDQIPFSTVIIQCAIGAAFMMPAIIYCIRDELR